MAHTALAALVVGGATLGAVGCAATAGSTRPTATVATAHAAPAAHTPAAAAAIGQTTLDVNGMAVVLSYRTMAPTRTLRRGDFAIDVALDAPPLPGRHPVVVISHGARGSAIADHALAARLAAAGFIVAQPQHRGDHFADDRLKGMDPLKQRPGQITEVIDALAAHPLWSAHAATDRVGLHGASIGGATALAVAGGRWNMLGLIRHCNTHREADVGFCFQGAAEPQARAERARNFDAARGLPDQYAPAALKQWHGGRSVAEGDDPRTDRRVIAVSLAVPAVAHFDNASLKRIRIPVGVVGATDDQVLLPRFHSQKVLQHCPTATLLHDARGAGHFDLLAPWPERIARQVAATQVRGGAPNPGFDPAERDAAQARIVAFHVSQLQPRP